MKRGGGGPSGRGRGRGGAGAGGDGLAVNTAAAVAANKPKRRIRNKPNPGSMEIDSSLSVDFAAAGINPAIHTPLPVYDRAAFNYLLAAALESALGGVLPFVLFQVLIDFSTTRIMSLPCVNKHSGWMTAENPSPPDWSSLYVWSSAFGVNSGTQLMKAPGTSDMNITAEEFGVTELTKGVKPAPFFSPWWTGTLYAQKAYELIVDLELNQIGGRLFNFDNGCFGYCVNEGIRVYGPVVRYKQPPPPAEPASPPLPYSDPNWHAPTVHFDGRDGQNECEWLDIRYEFKFLIGSAQDPVQSLLVLNPPKQPSQPQSQSASPSHSADVQLYQPVSPDGTTYILTNQHTRNQALRLWAVAPDWSHAHPVGERWVWSKEDKLNGTAASSGYGDTGLAVSMAVLSTTTNPESIEKYAPTPAELKAAAAAAAAAIAAAVPQPATPAPAPVPAAVAVAVGGRSPVLKPVSAWTKPPVVAAGAVTKHAAIKAGSTPPTATLVPPPPLASVADVKSEVVAAAAVGPVYTTASAVAAILPAPLRNESTVYRVVFHRAGGAFGILNVTTPAFLSQLAPHDAAASESTSAKDSIDRFALVKGLINLEYSTRREKPSGTSDRDPGSNAVLIPNSSVVAFPGVYPTYQFTLADHQSRSYIELDEISRENDNKFRTQVATVPHPNPNSPSLRFVVCGNPLVLYNYHPPTKRVSKIISLVTGKYFQPSILSPDKRFVFNCCEPHPINRMTMRRTSDFQIVCYFEFGNSRAAPIPHRFLSDGRLVYSLDRNSGAVHITMPVFDIPQVRAAIDELKPARYALEEDNLSAATILMNKPAPVLSPGSEQKSFLFAAPPVVVNDHFAAASKSTPATATAPAATTASSASAAAASTASAPPAAAPPTVLLGDSAQLKSAHFVRRIEVCEFCCT